MKNENARAEEITNDELEQVLGGTSVIGGEFIEITVRQALQPRPVVTPSNDFLFEESFDYPKKPFEQPR